VSTIQITVNVDETAHILPTQKTANKHLPFLDGIRGLMALWVACGHGFQDFIHVVDHAEHRSNFLPQPFLQQAFFAHFAVDVFIVLSGFCLMLPVARHREFELSGGWRTYLSRRSMRILPPYYSALILAGMMSGLRWLITYPSWEAKAIHAIDFSPTALIAHVLLIQNLCDPWARALDGPTWSVATECQIYLIFPLMLLPLWRRITPIIVIALATALGVAIYYYTQFGLSSCSWYIGLFAMGMYAAEWKTRHADSSRRHWLIISSVAFALSALFLIVVDNWMPNLMWALDVIIGAATALALAYYATMPSDAPTGPIMKVLQWQPLVVVGTFSYSFYLIHAPLLNVAVTLLLKYNASPITGSIALPTALAGIIGVARLFYKYIELPAMSKRLQSAQAAEQLPTRTTGVPPVST
jgi:peptidoglycan/LPS O-acetylase OafA/YrhL